MKQAFLPSAKPYWLRSELELVYAKTGNTLSTTISRQLRLGTLHLLKNGFYTTPEFVQSAGEPGREFLANALYVPSYLSLEYVLSRAGVIPEGIYAYTSVTTKPTRQFRTPIGICSYQHIKPALLTGYQQQTFQQSFQIKVATVAKALFDWLYLKPFPPTMGGKRQELRDLRINWESLTDADISEFHTYATLIDSEKMQQLANCLQLERNHVT